MTQSAPKTRIIFMGSPAFAVPSLVALAEQRERYDVVAVVTQPDKPAGRGQKLTPPEVKVAAIDRGIPVLQLTKMKTPDTLAALAAHQPDLIVVAAYGRILPKTILELPRAGCINVHASLLPRHRGASPIAHAILAGDRETGVAIMRMEEGLDTGPVFAQRSLVIEQDDTTGSMTPKLAALGATLLVEVLPDILAGKLTPNPQQGDATYAPLLEKEHGEIDFARLASELSLHVRGMSPWPGAFTMKSGTRVQVLRAHVVLGDMAAPPPATPPGTVVAAGSDGVVVACGVGLLCLDEIKPAGKSAMGAAAWVSGRQVKVGDVFEKVPKNQG